LCGKKAAKALAKYIHRLEKRKVEGLTEKQSRSLIKTATVIRSAIIQSKNK
jgi:hypothetical protein